MTTPEERAAFIADLVAAMKANDACLTQDEQTWVRLAIAKQEQSIRLRQAVIEKTFSGLVWSALLGLGYMVVDFAKNHGFK